MATIHENMSWDEYRGADRLNPSTIKVGYQKSMKHLRHALDHPKPSTEAMVIGSLCHTAVFEQHELNNRYIIYDGRRDKRMEGYQLVLEEADRRGMDIVKTAQFETAIQMGLAVATDPLVKPIIAKGKAEISLFTEEHGIKCKGRLDWVCSGRGFADLKTTANLTAEKFGWDFYKFGYDISLGLYQRWLSRARGQEEPCWVICVEKEPPYDVTVIPIPQAVLDRGAERGLNVIQRYKMCQADGVWPGVADGDEYYLHVPNRELHDDEIDMEGV